MEMHPDEWLRARHTLANMVDHLLVGARLAPTGFGCTTPALTLARHVLRETTRRRCRRCESLLEIAPGVHPLDDDGCGDGACIICREPYEVIGCSRGCGLLHLLTKDGEEVVADFCICGARLL
jgi:hypothetical protein